MSVFVTRHAARIGFIDSAVLTRPRCPQMG
jgi:hypothetical protein